MAQSLARSSHIDPSAIESIALPTTTPARRPKLGWPLRIIGATTVGLFLVLLYLGAQLPGGLLQPPLDKVAHFVLYFSLGVAGWLATGGRYPLAIIAVGSGLGALDEWRQLYLAGRHADGGDWVIDVIALAAAVIGLAWLWRRWLLRTVDDEP